MTRPATTPPSGILRLVDAVTVRVPDLDQGLAFYCEVLGHHLKWRDDGIGAAGLKLPDGASELVLTTEHQYEPNWLVESVEHAVEVFRAEQCDVIVEPHDIPVGRLAVVVDPFGNTLVLLDLSKGTYDTDIDGNVTGVS
jgi:catechol 2,3-dioxygenase-like lactoylglutathione lyase family enzyme